MLLGIQFWWTTITGPTYQSTFYLGKCLVAVKTIGTTLNFRADYV